jgi:hypothetical protein
LELLPQMEAKIAGIAAGNGFEGRIDLLADPDLSGASCRIEWADGRLERYDQAMWAQVSAALDRCLTVLGIAPPEQADLTTEAAGGADAGQAAESPRSE